MSDTLRRGIPSQTRVAARGEHTGKCTPRRPSGLMRVRIPPDSIPDTSSKASKCSKPGAGRIRLTVRIADTVDSNSIASRLLRQHNGTDVLSSRSIPERSV